MMSARTTIDHDLTCGGCDYNLRGLAVDGACPECGHGVAATVAGLSPTRARWLRRMATGSMLIGAGVLVGGLAFLFTVEDGRLLLSAFSTAAVIAAAGTWMFASGERRGVNWLGVVLRAAGVATMTLQLCVASSIATAHGILSGVPAIGPRHVMALCQTTAVVWGVAAILTCVRAAGLARRFRDPPGAAQAGLLGVLAACTFFVGVALLPRASGWILPHLVLAAIHTGWSIIFFAGFSIVLRRRARTMLAQPS